MHNVQGSRMFFIFVGVRSKVGLKRPPLNDGKGHFIVLLSVFYSIRIMHFPSPAIKAAVVNPVKSLHKVVSEDARIYWS